MNDRDESKQAPRIASGRARRSLLLAPLVCFAFACTEMTMAKETGETSPHEACSRLDEAARQGRLAADARTSRASYAIFSGGDRIGEVRSVRRVDETGSELEIASRTNIEIDSLFLSYSLASVESVCIVDGRMRSYRAQIEEDGERSSVQAMMSDDGRLRVSGSGSRESDTFEDVLDAEGYAVISETAAYSVIDGRTPRMTKVVLDTDDFKVKEITYRYGGTAEVLVGESSYTAHVVEFDTTGKRGTYWFVPDHGGYLSVLERGEDEDGRYSVELVTLERENPPNEPSKGGG